MKIVLNIINVMFFFIWHKAYFLPNQQTQFLANLVLQITQYIRRTNKYLR